MVKPTVFKPGDKVFVKTEGYVPWPAKITNVLGRNKFSVLFYGTQEIANIHKKDLVPYWENKTSYVEKYHVKKASYVDAIKQIEIDLVNESVDVDNQMNLDASNHDNDTTLEDASITVEKSASEQNDNDQIEEDLVNEGVDINNQINFDASNREIDRPLEDASITVEKSASKQNDNDQPGVAVVKKRGRPKKTRMSGTDWDSPEAKRVKRGRTSSVGKGLNISLSSSIELIENEILTREVRKTGKTCYIALMINKEIEDKIIALKQRKTDAEGEPAAVVLEEKGQPESRKMEVEKIYKFVGYKKPRDDLEIVTKKMLNNLILYAEHVRKNPELFMAKPVEARESSEKDIYAFKLPSGKVCGVKLYRNSPPKHKNEYWMAVFDERIAKAALEAETLLTTEKKTFEEIVMEVVPDIEITESDLNSITSLKDLGMEAKKRKIARRITESKLLEWDCKIRSSLDVDSAKLDTASDFMEEFREFENLDALMFKKYPHILNTVRRLREYFGDTEKWNLSDRELEIFELNAADIRIKAGSIYRRIQSLFPIDVEDDNEFWNSFLEIVSDFESKSKDLTECQVSELCAEPDSRQAFFDML